MEFNWNAFPTMEGKERTKKSTLFGYIIYSDRIEDSSSFMMDQSRSTTRVIIRGEERDEVTTEINRSKLIDFGPPGFQFDRIPVGDFAQCILKVLI